MGSYYMESTQINYRRDETLKTVDQKLQELSETSAIDTDIAPVFKSTNTYAPGDMVYYRNKLYVFNVEHSGAWAAADVTATDVTTEISSLKSGLTNYEKQNNLNLEVPNRKNVAGLLSFTNENNITFTADNSTGTVSASGSPLYSGWAAGACFTKQLPAGKYIVSCATNPNDLNVLLGMTSQGVITTEGVEITVNAGDTVRLAWSLTASESINYTATGVMIRPSFITDSTFTPYAPSVDTRLEAVENTTISVEGYSGVTINVRDVACHGQVVFGSVVFKTAIAANTWGNAFIMSIHPKNEVYAPVINSSNGEYVGMAKFYTNGGVQIYLKSAVDANQVLCTNINYVTA